MSLTISAKGSKEFAIHPAVPTAVRCTRIIDLGTQDGSFAGKPKKIHRIVFGFESAVLMPDTEGEYAGKPFLISERHTASLSEKANMRKFLQAWRGRPFTPAELEAFDLQKVLGKPAFINVVHSEAQKAGDRVYANIGSIMPLPAGMTAPEPVGDLIFFSLQDFRADVYEKLTDYFKGEVAKSEEYKTLFSGKPKASTKSPEKARDDMDDDIPF